MELAEFEIYEDLRQEPCNIDQQRGGIEKKSRCMVQSCG